MTGTSSRSPESRLNDASMKYSCDSDENEPGSADSVKVLWYTNNSLSNSNSNTKQQREFS